jgi:DNA-binding transcriptional regulator LsrR (DeoR family)
MLYDEILKELQTDYNNRVTQTEMATKYNTTQGSIQRLLSDNKNILGIKVETLQRMFPDTTIYGKLQTTNNQKVINSNTGNNIQIVGEKNFASPDKTLDQILNKVMENDKFTAEAKVEFFNIIKKFKG